MHSVNDTPATEPVTTGDLYDKLLEADSATETPAAEPAQQEPEQIPAPEHWSAEDKAFFTSQPRQVQEWALSRHKAMEGDYTRKTQEIADQRRQYEHDLTYANNLRQVWTPLAQRYQAYGMDDSAVQRMAAAYMDFYSRDPQGFVKWLAEQSGFQSQTQPEQTYEDPTLAPFDKRLGQIETALQQQQRIQQYGFQQYQQAQERLKQQQVEQLQSKVSEITTSFATEKHADGSLKHPHFANENIKRTMGALMANLNVEMEDAYQQAIRMLPPNPADKVGKALKAGATVQGGKVDVYKQGSMRDTIGAVFDQLQST